MNDPEEKNKDLEIGLSVSFILVIILGLIFYYVYKKYGQNKNQKLLPVKGYYHGHKRFSGDYLGFDDIV
jgi:hypothetical protein